MLSQQRAFLQKGGVAWGAGEVHFSSSGTEFRGKGGGKWYGMVWYGMGGNESLLM